MCQAHSLRSAESTWPNSSHMPARAQELDLHLTAFQAFLVASSEKLWQKHVHKIASEYCCKVARHEGALSIVGVNAEGAFETLSELLQDPPSDIVTCARATFRWN